MEVIGDSLKATLLRKYELEDKRKIVLEEKKVLDALIKEIDEKIRLDTMSANQGVMPGMG